MQATDGMLVTIEYTLRNGKGEVVESSKDNGAVTFRVGDGRMLPGLAKAIEGMSVGDTRKGTIPPGQLVPTEKTATLTVLLSEFPDGVRPKVGDRFQAKSPEGQPVMFEVFEEKADAVEVRLLHILHDEEVAFEVEVLAVRKPGVPPPPPVGDVPDMTEDLEEA